MEWIVVTIGVCFISIYTVYMIIHHNKKNVEQAFMSMLNNLPKQQATPQVNVNMKPVEDAIKALPNKVLQSIQASTNTKKGALGELIGYLELEAMYDRIIPLGSITDFMCLKFPTDKDEGRIDFVDIKTGKSARLSKEQKLLQQLIIDKKINFIKLSVNTQSSETIIKSH